MSKFSDALLRELRAFGRKHPGAHGKSPWPGHDDLAVNDKIFAYLGIEGEPFSLSCKLPYTGEVALDLPYAKPTAYGLGKSGWSLSRRTMMRCLRSSSSRNGSTRAIGHKHRRSS